jgi:hypothetical protein
MARFVDQENRFMDLVVLVLYNLNISDGGVGNVDEVWVTDDVAVLKDDSLLGLVEVFWRIKQQN